MQFQESSSDVQGHRCSSTTALSSRSYRHRSVDGIRHGKTESVVQFMSSHLN